jgi:hypothetical protein
MILMTLDKLATYMHADATSLPESLIKLLQQALAPADGLHAVMMPPAPPQMTAPAQEPNPGEQISDEQIRMILSERPKSDSEVLRVSGSIWPGPWGCPLGRWIRVMA